MRPALLRPGLLGDALGIAFGAFMAPMGISMPTHPGFLTGPRAGLAILIACGTGRTFGPVILVADRPFWWGDCKRFGPVDPVAGAVLAGCPTGVGVWRCSCAAACSGGIGIVGLQVVRDTSGFRAAGCRCLRTRRPPPRP